MSKKYYYIDTHTGERREQTSFEHHCETIFIAILFFLFFVLPIWFWIIR